MSDQAQPAAETVEVTVGKIGRAHGLRGDVFIDVRTDAPERRFAVGTRFDTVRGVLEVASVRWHGNRLLVRFAQASDRDAAERLRGTELTLVVPADERPDDPEEYYDHQLRGLRAVTTDGAEVGIVADVLHLPNQDTLVLDADSREILVPFVSDVVPVVDLAAGVLRIVDRPGLLSPEISEGPGAD